MLSFEVSAIDIVLVISAIIILLLYLMKQTQPSTGSESDVKEKKTEARAKFRNLFGHKRVETSSQAGSFRCPYSFGYLKKIPKDGSIPEECYTCPQMMQCCAFSGEGSKELERE